ncbi:DUF2278 family protein [Frigoriglobus tundricola]|uniref:DUF2278 domain-containing protein n=1 Tax=Frigoriglobus tundricola TaxID=2774151 RepID=A0A6M5YUM6_9BACT|nr:DUF2278 family protein [Frigoriglobus tundricola]QJW97619.1 hypothetical protein FTUN_5194 [Frigoriglobus tundricola]
MSHKHHGPHPHPGGPEPHPGGTETKTYGFVKCRVAGNVRMQKKALPKEVQYHLHADLTVAGSDRPWDTAINVGTNDSDDLLNYRLATDFHHAALITQLKAAAAGFHKLTGTAQLPALDFLRSDVLAETGPWRVSDPMDGTATVMPAASLKALLERAAAEHADVYIFGRTYTTGGSGIHDVHMNQGSRAPFLHSAKDGNDVWQDGAVLFDFGEPQWIGYFTAFTQQTAPTDAVGDPVAGGHGINDTDPGSLAGH